ncbi:adenylate/guanylate cyclase domain-containing protein [Haladaptatus sp. DFWS20]|uniref:adenylate/guanylate cyclase domain-containing protein n=1 Tax=Haladaptatus sp. DFWS20 TaxID=3403467 RepID=UPI003EC0E0BF
MSKPTLTRSEKRKIVERLYRRADHIEERVRNISSGRSIPIKEHQRLNEPKRFELAIVFVDINDFTKYVMDNGPKKALYMVSVFMSEAMKLVQDFNGYFEKNTGDGLLAYFGFGKDASEAVVELLSYLSTVKWVLNEHVNLLFEENKINSIQISAGAAYGPAYLSRIGAKNYEQELNRITAVSNAANIASKLESIAGKNELLTGPNVWFHADKEMRSHLSPYDTLEGFSWKNPSTNESEDFQIYKYSGEWSGEVQHDQKES